MAYEQTTSARQGDKSDSHFFFVHVQKTAGTSLLMHLRQNFPEAEVYPNRTDGDPVRDAPQISLHILKRRWAERGDEIRLVAGHFPLCVTEILGGGFTTLTVLRDPVERTLSYLRHFRATTPGAADLSLDDIYDDPDRFQRLVHNHMVKMFSLQPNEMTFAMMTAIDFTPAHLERAKQQLATVDAVGLQEHFPEFCAELEQRFGWHFGAAIHANQTEPVEVSRDLRARIADDNDLDVKLYGFACELTAQRRRQSDSRPREVPEV